MASPTATLAHEPTAFEVYVGGFGRSSYGAWWEGRQVIYESFVNDYGAREQAQLSPSAAQWERFWRTVEQLRVWDWAPRYEPGQRFEPPTVVRDGVHWSLTLAHADQRVESSGDSAGPGAADLDDSAAFTRFLDALSRLLGGRPFS